MVPEILNSSIKISLNNIRLHAFHGVLPQERIVGGDYILNVGLEVADNSAALVQDKLEGTVDYAAAYEAIKEEMMHPSQLLENVCYRIARRLLADFSMLRSVNVSITKLSPPIAGAAIDGATVEITLGD